jgi:hypothetical protein
MQPTTISVTFRKAVSDGNYGTEAAEVTVTAELTDDGDYRLQHAALLAQARATVHSELNQSPSSAVRRALQRQEPAPPRPAARDEDPF